MPIRCLRSWVFACVLAACLLPAPGAPAEGAFPASNVPPRQEFEGTTIDWNLIRLPTRPGVQQGLLVGRPRGSTRGVALLFPGGGGARMFRTREDGFRLGGNFLVRSAPLFAKEGFVAAIVDAPSDHASGMGDDFRTGSDHAADVRAAVEHFAREGVQSIFLIGTSRGTLSVASLAARLRHPRVKGFVLTSSMDNMISLPLEEVTSPALVVHHTDDECRLTTYSGARASFARLGKSPRKHFISVSGGDTPISRACQALSAHGYLGMERETVRAIAQWLRGEAAPAQVGR